MHDAALEALIDELIIGGIIGWLAGGRTPDLQVEPRQQGWVGVRRILRGNRTEEARAKVDLLTVERIRRLVLDECQNIRGVVRIAYWRGRCDDRRIGGEKRAPINPCVGHQARVQQVQRLDSTVRLYLHDLALEDLYLKPVELECPRDGVTEGSNAAARLEEVPERISVDAVAGLRKKAGIRCLAVNRVGSKQDADNQRRHGDSCQCHHTLTVVQREHDAQSARGRRHRSCL